MEAVRIIERHADDPRRPADAPVLGCCPEVGAADQVVPGKCVEEGGVDRDIRGGRGDGLVQTVPILLTGQPYGSARLRLAALLDKVVPPVDRFDGKKLAPSRGLLRLDHHVSTALGDLDREERSDGRLRIGNLPDNGPLANRDDLVSGRVGQQKDISPSVHAPEVTC